MSLNSSDYLSFDASDIQALLRRKLTQSGIMTDQLYPGSDLKIIIDLFAWTFNVMSYMINNAASDALFADTVLYENMNRLVKILGYNPIGFRTSQSQFKISINNSVLTKLLPQTINIPRFASLDIGKTDQYGNTVYYTLLDSYSVSIYSYLDSKNKPHAYVITPQSWPTLYNGQIRKYATVFYSTSISDQTFQLSQLDADSQSNPDYCDHNSFYVFIETINTDNGQSQYQEWHQVENLTLNAQGTDHYYQLRLNEDKKYVLKFGNNIHGAIPQKGAAIHILYLKSNGQEGKIDANQVQLSEIRLHINGFMDQYVMINMLYNGIKSFTTNYGSLFINNSIFSNTTELLTFTNIDTSSQPSTFETVDDIRQRAPNAFRTGQRLITNYDFETYILANFANLISHVYVNNNTYYISTFYRWLNKYGALNIGIRKYYYKFANACDFNNIYIWMKSSNELSQLNMKKIVNKCNPYKSLTSQLVPLASIDTYFVPFVQHEKEDYAFTPSKSLSDLDDYLSRIKIIVYKNTVAIISDDQLKQKINNIIINYFSLQNQRFGSIINLSEILQEIYNTGYVKLIKTINTPNEDPNDVAYSVGLSFACFTSKFIDNKDFEVFTGSISLQNFQFPTLYITSFLNMIEIKDETHSLTNTEF